MTTSLKEMRDLILASPPSGSLRTYGDWFGRPYDNGHQVVSAETDGQALVLGFHRGEKLTITNPSGLVISPTAFSVAKADCVRWEWYFYGKPQTPANLYYEEHRLEDGRVHAESNVDWYTPEFSPSVSLPAVELL